MKIKNYGGFIQIPILIAIIVGVMILSGTGYFGVKKYQKYQLEKIQKEGQVQETIQAQQKAVQGAQQGIEAVGIVGQKTRAKLNETVSGGGKTSTVSPSSVPSVIAATTTSAKPSSGGGGGGGASRWAVGIMCPLAGEGPCTEVIDCSQYKNEFASIPNCAYYADQAGDSGGVPDWLYKVCKQCFPADTSLPLISNIQTINIAENSATITWVTSELANSEIVYATWSLSRTTSTTPMVLSPMKVIESATNTINHSFNLDNLTKGTVYYYEVTSVRAANGRAAGSKEQSFTTLSSTATSTLP